MVRPLRLDRQAQVLRAAVVDDGLQSRRGVYAPTGSPVWEARSDVSGGEKTAGGQTIATMMVRFTMRKVGVAAGLTVADRLNCDGVTFDIHGIKDVPGGRLIEVTALGRVG